MTEPISKLYSKDFLNAVDTALIGISTTNAAAIVIYRRAGKLDIRVKVELAPPPADSTPVIIIPEGK